MHRSSRRPCLPAMLAASLAISTAALANTWTNTLGGVFSDGGNWKEGAAPTSGVEAKFSGAAGTFTVTATGDIESGAATFDGNQNVTLDLGAGNTWTLDDSRYFTVGDGANSLDVYTTLALVSGSVTNAYKVLTANRAVNGVHLTVANPGTVLASRRDDLNIGWNGPNTTVEVLRGAKLQGGRSFLVGQSAVASNNTITVSGEGSWIGNGPTSGNAGVKIGWRSADNSVTIADGATIWCEQNNFLVGDEAAASNNCLVVRDGGFMHIPTHSLFVGNNGGGNSVEISNGSKGVANGQTNVGQSSSGNSLSVTGGSAYCPGTHLYVGQNAAACSNSVLIADEGTIVTNKAYDFNCGNSGSYNTWTIEDGAYVGVQRSFIVGTTGNSSYNRARIADPGTFLHVIGNDIKAGQAGIGNEIVVTDGARLLTAGALYVGGGSSDNTSANACSNLFVLAGGAVSTNGSIQVGSKVSSADNALVISNATLRSNSMVTIGQQGPRCRLEVRNGGVLTTGHHFFFGDTASASNTVVLVSGAGTRLDNNYDIDVGKNARDCYMAIEDGAYVRDNRNFYVGHNATASNNVLRVANATLDVTVNNTSLCVNYGGRLEIGGTNTVINLKKLELYNGSTLAFDIPRGGFATPVSTVNVIYEAGTKLEIDALEYAKAGGGDITLMNFTGKSGTALDNMTLLPAGIEVFEESGTLRIHVPNLAGTLILLK